MRRRTRTDLLVRDLRALATAPPVWLIGLLGAVWLAWQVRIPTPGYGADVHASIVRWLPEISRMVQPDQRYLYSSPPMLVLAWAAGITTPQALTFFGAATVVVAMTAVAWQTWRLHGRAAASLVMAAFSASTAAVIVTTTAGLEPDPFTLLAGSAIVLAATPPGALVAGVLLGLAHFEQGVGILASLAVLAATGRWGRLRLVGWAAVGAVCGKVVVAGFTRILGVDTGRTDFMLSHLDELTTSFQQGMPAFLGTMFGAAWVLIGFRLCTTRPWWPWLAAMVVPLAFTTLAYDQTRVFAVMTWPMLMAAGLSFAEDRPDRTTMVTWLLLAAMVLWPIGYVWAGSWVVE